MAIQFWPKKLLKIVTVGGTAGIISYAINYDVFYADSEAMYSVPKMGIPWNNDWDSREPDPVTKPIESGDCPTIGRKIKKKPIATRNIFLIRHGDYSLNGDGGLSNLGIAQAEFTGIKLRELGFQYNIIVHSTMQRAIETANIINNYVPTAIKAPTEAIVEGVPIKNIPETSLKSPESRLKQDGHRIENAFRLHFHRAESWQKTDTFEIMVCHANVIRYFVCRAMQFPPEAWLRFALFNCSITWLVIHPNGRVELKSCGDSGHIPSRLLSC